MLKKQAAEVSRGDRDIPKSSSSHPRVIWSNLIQSDPILRIYKLILIIIVKHQVLD